jgi:rubrerythrin
VSSEDAAGAAIDGPGRYDPGDDRPGDPACLLRRVCPACGAVADHDPPTTCPQCHTEMPAG